MPTSRLMATALLTFALLAGVARAGGPWQQPPSIASTGLFCCPGLTFSGDGHALATLDGAPWGQPSSVLVAAPGGSAFTETGRALLLARPAPYGPRGIAFLRAPTPPAGPHPLYAMRETRLGVSLGLVTGGLGRLHALARLAAPP